MVRRPVRLRGDRPVPLAVLAQQVDAVVVVEELEVVRGPVHRDSRQHSALGRHDAHARRPRALLGTQRPQEGDERAHVGIGKREAGHTRAGQAVVDERGQLVVAAQCQSGHDRRTVLAAVAVSAVARGTHRLELAFAGLGRLREGSAGSEQGAEQHRG